VTPPEDFLEPPHAPVSPLVSLDAVFAEIDALQAEAVGGGDYGAGQRGALREARQAIARRFLTDAMDATENREWE